MSEIQRDYDVGESTANGTHSTQSAMGDEGADEENYLCRQNIETIRTTFIDLRKDFQHEHDDQRSFMLTSGFLWIRSASTPSAAFRFTPRTLTEGVLHPCLVLMGLAGSSSRED
jgi:hypothetical protein